MKKILALLLAAVMCFSLVACGGGEETPNTDDSSAQEQQAQNDNNEPEVVEPNVPVPESTETENTEPENTEPQYETVEITLDNWQDYFEYSLTVSPRTNAFGEVETLIPVMKFHLKDEWASITTDMDVALEYNAIDTYSCMFSYNIDTGEFGVGEKIEDKDTGGLWGFTKTMDETNIEAGVSLFGTPIPGKAEVEGNIAEIVGSMYATIEILRIQGTLTIVKQ